MPKIAGLVSFTTIDFPGQLAAVVFLKGCPLRCPFCHNPELIDPSGPGLHTWDEIESFLVSRKKRLDGVVFSGGEPLMQPAVIDAAKKSKELGYRVAVHTSGIYSKRLAEILPFLDWVGLDIKSSWKTYDKLSGLPVAKIVPQVQESLKLLLESKIPFECRTTCDPRYITKEDILELAADLSAAGATEYALQKYRTFDTDKNPPSDAEIEQFFTDEAFLTQLRTHFPNLILR